MAAKKFQPLNNIKDTANTYAAKKLCEPVQMKIVNKPALRFKDGGHHLVRSITSVKMKN